MANYAYDAGVLTNPEGQIFLDNLPQKVPKAPRKKGVHHQSQSGMHWTLQRQKQSW